MTLINFSEIFLKLHLNSRTRDGDMFYEATAVLMAELVKFFTCLFLVYKDLHYDINEWKNTLYQTIWINKVDTLKVRIYLVTYFLSANF